MLIRKLTKIDNKFSEPKPKKDIILLLDIIKNNIGYRNGTKPLGDGICKMTLVQKLCPHFNVKLVDEENRIDFFNLMEGILVTSATSDLGHIRIKSGGSSGMHIIKRLGLKYIPSINRRFDTNIDKVIDPAIPPIINPPFNPKYKWDVIVNTTTALQKCYDGWDEVFRFIEKLGLTYKTVDNFNEFGLIDLASALKQSKFYIGLDSGVSHLAASCRIPGLILFAVYYHKNKWSYPMLNDYLQFRPLRSIETLDYRLVNFRLKKALISKGII